MSTKARKQPDGSPCIFTSSNSLGTRDDPGEDDGEDGDGSLDGVRVRHLRLPDGDVSAH